MNACTVSRLAVEAGVSVWVSVHVMRGYVQRGRQTLADMEAQLASQLTELAHDAEVWP